LSNVSPDDILDRLQAIRLPCSCVILSAMPPSKGDPPMSPDIRARWPESACYGALRLPLADSIRLRANWGERVVTVLATSIAVLIVAVIAVLMGMA
jgi:hypothetical protein